MFSKFSVGVFILFMAIFFSQVSVLNANSTANVLLVKTGEYGAIEWTREIKNYTDRFIKQYGNLMISSSIRTPDGGYVVVGGTDGITTKHNLGLVIKISSNKNVEWVKTYGGNGFQYFYLVKQTRDKGFIAVGKGAISRLGEDVFWAVKFDASGNIQWQKAYGGDGRDIAYSVTQTSDGGYALAGSTTSFGVKNKTAWVVKLDASGNIQWQKAYGGDGRDIAYSVTQTSDGGYALAGSTTSFGVKNKTAWVVKLDASGNIVFSESSKGESFITDATTVEDTKAKEDSLTVESTSYAFLNYLTSLDANNTNAKISTQASQAENDYWLKTYSVSYDDNVSFITQTSDGGYIVIGNSNVLSKNFSSIWVLRLSRNGDIVWQKSYGKSNIATIFGAVTQISDGDIVIAGNQQYTLNSFLLMQVNIDNGSIEWQKHYRVSDNNFLYFINSISQTGKGFLLAGYTSPIASPPYFSTATGGTSVNGTTYQRFSEGTQVLMEDDSIFRIVTAYTGMSDLAISRLLWYTSKDRGRSWSELNQVIIPGESDVQVDNKISVPSLARLSDGTLILVYLYTDVDNNPDKNTIVKVTMSHDNAKSWSKPTVIARGSLTPGINISYWSIAHDRLSVLNSGRIIMPIYNLVSINDSDTGKCLPYYSDDNGITWRHSNIITIPNWSCNEIAIREVPKEDNNLLMLIRNKSGYAYYSTSKNGGENWTTPEATNLKTPFTSINLKVINNELRALYNKGTTRDNLTMAKLKSKNDFSQWVDIFPITNSSAYKDYISQQYPTAIVAPSSKNGIKDEILFFWWGKHLVLQDSVLTIAPFM